MALIDRLAGLNDPEGGQKLAVNTFHAAMYELAAGQATKAEVVSYFSLDAQEETELDWIIGRYNAQPNAAAKKLIETSFGSMDAWLADTKAALMSGHGWVVLAYDYTDKKLLNNLIRTEHDVGLFANVHLMAAIDAWEHAYFADYQTKKADYVANVLSGLNWDVINGRLGMVTGGHGA